MKPPTRKEGKPRFDKEEMAFRFTDSEKHGSPWYRRLPPDRKALWQFFKDECDHAGILEVDTESIKFHVGLDCDIYDIHEWFDAKLIWITPEKIFIPQFLDEQYGRGHPADLEPSNRTHASVISILEANNINPNDYHLPLLAPSKELKRPIEGRKDKDKAKDKEKDTGEKMENFELTAPEPKPKKKKPREMISTEPLPEFLELKEMLGGQIGQIAQRAWIVSYGVDFVKAEIRKAYSWNAQKGNLRKDLNRFYGGWLARGWGQKPKYASTHQSEELSPMARELRKMEEEQKNGKTD